MSGSKESTEFRRSRSWVSMDFTSCAHDGLGQVADQVREIVELHAFGGGQQLFRVHALDDGLAHVFAELDQYVAFDFGLDEVPDHLTLRRWQRFDQQFAISAGCMAATMRAAPRHEPSRNAPRSAASRRSLVGVRVASMTRGSVLGSFHHFA